MPSFQFRVKAKVALAALRVAFAIDIFSDMVPIKKSRSYNCFFAFV